MATEKSVDGSRASALLPCVSCDGNGVRIGMFPRYAPGYEGPRKPYIELKCDRCNGSGQMPAVHVEWMKIGEEMKRERLSRNMTLRAEAVRRGMSPSELSKMEQGIVEPVSSDVDWDRKLSDVQFFIEATIYEQIALRKINQNVQFEQESLGMSHVVGVLDDRPVNVSFCFGSVNGLRVAFWEPVSEVVDHKMIREWFENNYVPKWDGGTRAARCNAMNFHHVVEAADELVV